MRSARPKAVSRTWPGLQKPSRRLPRDRLWGARGPGLLSPKPEAVA